MKGESSVEGEGARYGTQHDQRLDQPLWECQPGSRGCSEIGRARQSLICWAERRLDGVGAATGELKLKVERLRLQLQ
jgi:hypothetical protein